MAEQTKPNIHAVAMDFMGRQTEGSEYNKERAALLYRHKLQRGRW